MLKRVRVQNYLSCQSVILDDLSEITALIGRNGAGKTNLLRALNWLSYVTTKARQPHEPFRDIWPDQKPARVEVEAVIGKRTYTYSVERGYKQPSERGKRWDLHSKETLTQKEGDESQTIFDRHNQDINSRFRDAPVRLGTLAGSLIGLASILPPGEPLVKAIRPMLSFLSSIRYYPIDEPCEPQYDPEHAGFVAEKSYQEWVARYNETGNPGDSVPMRLLHMFLSKSDKYKELQEMVGPDGLDIIHALYVHPYKMQAKSSEGEEATFYDLRFWPTQCSAAIDPRGFRYSQLSTGTRRILKILVSLVFDASDVMLLEHPEDGIHTLLVKKLVSLLKAFGFPAQIIMTSHSSTILNELGPAQVRLVSMESCATKVRALKPSEMKSAARYMSEEGTLAEFIELAEA